MARFGLCGASYTSQSPNSDDQQLMNWYLEQNQDPNAKSPFSLYPFGGLKVFIAQSAFADAPERGKLAINGRLFAVVGAGLFELFADGTISAKLGTVTRDTVPVTFASSATQFMVTSGGSAYCYDLTSNVFTDISPLMLGQISMCAYLNSYFIALLDNSNQFQWSSPGDVTQWDGADTAKITVFPDNCVSMAVVNGELRFRGLTKTVSYDDTGTFNIIFEPNESSVIDQGSGARFGSVQMDNSDFWWGADNKGRMIAWRANGYLPGRVSTHAVEFAVQGYSEVSDAVSYTFQDQGHTFWQTYFPSANGGKGATWVYDAATGQWAQRSFLQKGFDVAHRSWTHTFAFGKHLVGDPLTGSIYEMHIPVANAAGGWDFADDFGNPIRRLRRCPILSTENQPMFFHELEVDGEWGLGPTPPLLDGDGNPRAPQLMLRFANDSGKTWSNEQTRGCGMTGEYDTRVVFTMLGSSRKGRIFEISATDPVPWRITDGYLRATGYGRTQRLSERLRQGA